MMEEMVFCAGLRSDAPAHHFAPALTTDHGDATPSPPGPAWCLISCLVLGRRHGILAPKRLFVPEELTVSLALCFAGGTSTFLDQWEGAVSCN